MCFLRTYLETDKNWTTELKENGCAVYVLSTDTTKPMRKYEYHTATTEATNYKYNLKSTGYWYSKASPTKAYTPGRYTKPSSKQVPKIASRSLQKFSKTAPKGRDP